MRAALQRSTHNMKQFFETGNPGCNWVYGLDQLRLHILGSSSSGLPVDHRLWQPLVPQLIRSFQLTRDILHALPQGDHVALERDLYTLGLRASLGPLFRLGGGPAGQAWRFRCGLEAIRLALDPKGAVQCNQNLRDNVELPLLNCVSHCMHPSVSVSVFTGADSGKCVHWS